MAGDTDGKVSLMTLPGEIQNRIYSYAVVSDEPIVLFICENDQEAEKLEPGQPSLMRACRKLREEVGSIYYGENVFSICISPILRFPYSAARNLERQSGSFAKQIIRVHIREANNAASHVYVETCLEAAGIRAHQLKTRTTITYHSCRKYVAKPNSVDQETLRTPLFKYLLDWPRTIKDSWDVSWVSKHSCDRCGKKFR